MNACGLAQRQDMIGDAGKRDAALRVAKCPASAPMRQIGRVEEGRISGSGTVTLPNRARNKSAGMLGSRRSDDVAPGLHRRGPEGSVRFCGGEMALDVESVVSGCVG
jgi:hypothetical protein